MRHTVFIPALLKHMIPADKRQMMPPLHIRLKNIVQATQDVTNFARKNGRVIASDEIVKARIETCNQCQYMVAGVCSMCGCHLRLKIKLESQKCPQGKWAQ